MKRLLSILLVCGALAGVLAFGAQRAGIPLPFGVRLPGGSAEAAAGTEVTIGTVYFEGAGESTSVVVGNGGTVRLSAGYGLQSSGTAAPRVSLERRVGSGRWQRTAAAVAIPDGKPITVLTPAFSTSGASAAVAYRLVSGTSVSRTMTVTYENQRHYTGMARTVYADLAEYCPTTAVHIVRLHGREAGDYRTGALLIRVDAAVGVTTVTRPIDIRALALHECSHERQWMDYGATSAGRKAMTAAAVKYFTMPGSAVDPVEHAADCGAQSENPGGYLGYGGTCTAVALREGRRLLHGERY